MTPLLSSPGGNLEQAIIMGEIIRSRGLVTAVGVADASGRVRPLLLRQRLRAGLCRRQDPLRRPGLQRWESIALSRPLPCRPRRRRPARRRVRSGLHDEDGRLLHHRGGDVANPGHTLARHQGGLGDEPHHRSRRQALQALSTSSDNTPRRTERRDVRQKAAPGGFFSPSPIRIRLCKRRGNRSAPARIRAHAGLNCRQTPDRQTMP